jgi:hypothetical protein
MQDRLGQCYLYIYIYIYIHTRTHARAHTHTHTHTHTYIWWTHCLHLSLFLYCLWSATICLHLRIDSGVFEHRCVSTVIQLTYEDRIIPSSLSSVWITTIDPFSARHHAFWWEDEVQALRMDGTVPPKRWPEECYRNIRCMGKLRTPRKWIIASMQRRSKRPVSSRSSKAPVISASELKNATNFLGQKLSLFRDLKKLVRSKRWDERPANRWTHTIPPSNCRQ